MSVDSQVFKAILAMDAYNRGYKPKIDDLPATGEIGKPPIKIGHAEILIQSETKADSAERKASFYAIAYTYKGETIISYRGTDDNNVLRSSSDVWNGWVAGAGVQSSQVNLAIKFYQAVQGTFQDTFETGKITLTGHSLGGGLAGMIGSLYGKEAAIFDTMPFELAAGNA